MLCSNCLSYAGKDVKRQDRTPEPSLVYLREPQFTGDSLSDYLSALHSNFQKPAQGSLCQNWLKHPFSNFRRTKCRCTRLCCCSIFHCLHSSRSQIVQLIISVTSTAPWAEPLSSHMVCIPFSRHGTLHSPKHSLTLHLPRDPNLCHSSV